MTIDQLHGTLVDYEMRIEDEDTSRKEASFKVSSKQARKNKSTKDKPTSDESDDEEITNFVRKLKRGTRKYKGKLPLKFFSCGKIDHFASKFPYEKNSDGEEYDSFKPYKKYNNYKNKNIGNLQRIKDSIQKGTKIHTVVNPTMKMAMTLMMEN